MVPVHACSRSLCLTVAIIVSGLLGGRAEAQLISCAAPGGPYKIFVDEVRSSSTGTNSASLAKDLQGLRDFVVADLTTLTAGQASVRPCGRFPQHGPDDWDDTEMNLLDNQRVLLEVWGAANDPAHRRGLLGFVLVPAWELTPPAVYIVSRNAADFLQEAKRGAELRAFAPLALGIRAYRNQQYNESIPPLCQGVHELDALLASPPGALEDPLRADLTTLLTNVRKIVSEAIKAARAKEGSRYILLRPGADGRFTCPTA